MLFHLVISKKRFPAIYQSFINIILTINILQSTINRFQQPGKPSPTYHNQSFTNSLQYS